MHLEKPNLSIIATVFAAIFLLGACSEKQEITETSDVSEVAIPNKSAESDYVPVTKDNYIQAETDWNFAGQQAKRLSTHGYTMTLLPRKTRR